jgi:predicted enzyme related to lactoylglutathione lyase
MPGKPGGNPPTLGNGKICYIEIPASNVPRSADFYHAVFGWQIRRRGDGQTAFDDAVGQVSGAWVAGRTPSPQPGVLVYIMVANGGEIVQPIGADAPEITARFRDPAGNVLGLYQEPGRSASGADT